MDRTEWQDEIEYIAGILRTNGDAYVPAHLVDDYVSMQAAQAGREGYHDAAARIEQVRDEARGQQRIPGGK